MIRFLQTPTRAKKVLLGGLLLVICVLLVITLIPGGFLGDAFGFGGTTQGVLAKVGDQEVTVLEVQQRARQIMRQRGFPQQLLPLLTQQAAQQLVLQKALLVEASRLGLRATDEELRQELHTGVWAQELFPNGNFIGQDRYESFVSQQFQFSVAQFEELIKQDLLMRKLQGLVQDGVTVSQADVEREYRAQNTRVKLEYAVLSLDTVAKEVSPSESELKAYFDRNKDRYANAIPEKRRAKYVVVDRARIQDQVQVTREDLQRYYDQRKDQYRVSDEVNVRHILVKAPPPGPDGNADLKAVEAARTKAEGLLKQLKAGAKFEELARKNSDDPGSKENGGSLGWIGKGRTVPEFEKAAFSLEKGQTSGLVQSTFGFHIIHLDDKRSAHLQTLDEVRATIEPAVRQEKAARAAEAMVNTLRSQARTSGLEAAAAKQGLQVIHSPLFSRTDSLPGVGSAPEFLDAVFSAREKSPPELARTPQGYVVFEVTEVKPPAKPTFEEIRARLESDFKQDRAAALLQQKTQELSDRARAEHDLKKAAREAGATTKTSELVTRDSQVPDIGQMSGPAAVAFTLQPGQISGPINTGRAGVVLSLLERQEPTPAEFAIALEQTRDALLQKRRSEVMELFASNLRQRMEKEGKIRYNKEERDRIFNPRGGIAGG